MSAAEYYDHTTYPSTGAAGSSAAMRSELEAIEAGFGKLPDLSGKSTLTVQVNAGGTALVANTNSQARTNLNVYSQAEVQAMALALG